MRTAEWGPMIVETDVDAATLDTLKLWVPTYIAQAERERGLTIGTIARPNPRESYDNALEDGTFPEGRLPAIIVTTAQMPVDPEPDGDGFLYAAWRVNVTSVVRGRTGRETRWIASMFGGIVRRVLLDHRSLGGFAGGLRLVGGGRVLPVRDATDQDRFLAASVSPFTVHVDQVFRMDGGPAEAEPYEPPDPAAPDYDPDAPYDPVTSVGDVPFDLTTRSLSP